MKCPKCQTDNTDTARYCSNCATSLSRAGVKPQPSFTKTLDSPVEIPQGTIFAGKYEILEKLGQGGMGEVYRALDKNLSRQVAIKILPEEFAQDRERMARFEREAKLLAVLNHPNIASIYGLEESEGRRFLVLELVEGETLASRLGRGSLPVDEALETGKQIAEGLEAAHEKGIIHRDLKPGNIMLTPEGKVKILDFGLAKAYTAETTDIDIEESPTITAQMTAPGVIMGTAAYMSPEQARSRAVDKRTDVWSFGCLLYECLTGKRAFEGETVSDTMALILKGEPEWASLPGNTPPIIKTLLARCLQKDRQNRQHDIADARIEIEESSGSPQVPVTDLPRRPVRSWILGSIIGGLVLGAVATVLITRHFRLAAVLPIVRFPLMLESGYRLAGWSWEDECPTRTAMAISSDGRFIVYCGYPKNPSPEETTRIYLRRMDQIDAAPVAGTEGGDSPFLSPDDQWIGFWEGDKLKKVPIGGGVPTTICDSDVSFGADWGPDNTIVFASSFDGGLSWIADQGGTEEILTIPDKTREEFGHRLPHFLPGGRALLFTVMGQMIDLRPRLALLDLENREWRVVMEDAADGRYLRTGHLVFLRRGILMAVGFDLDRMKLIGEPVPIVGNVMQALNISSGTHNSSSGQYCVSDAGWLAYVPGGIALDVEGSLVKVDQEGNLQPAVDFKAPFFFPRFSPDGQRIAYVTQGTEYKLWIYDSNRGNRSPLTDDGLALTYTWTPDGQSLVFAWHKSGVPNLYRQPVDGSSPMERFTTSENMQFPGSFAPNGKTLAFVEFHPETGGDILLLNMESRQVTPFLNSKAYEGFPEISPDGRWMAYASNESGSMEVWVRPFPGPGRKWQISNEGGSRPIWSKNGRQLFYRNLEVDKEKLWAVDIRTDGGFFPSKPHLLFELQGLFGATDPIRSWDIFPDEQGFLMVKAGEREPQPVTEMILIQNWFEELKRLVPVGK